MVQLKVLQSLSLIENASCTYKFNAFPFSLGSLYPENLYQTKYRKSNSTVMIDVCRHKEGNVGICPRSSEKGLSLELLDCSLLLVNW